MQRYQNNVISLVGPPFVGLTPLPGVGVSVEGFTVSVLNYPGLGTSSIFSDNASPAAVKENPFAVDSDGDFFFYAENGRYQLRLLKAGIISRTFPDILISDSRRTVNIGTPLTVAANVFQEHSVTLSGLAVGDFVAVNKPTFQAGVNVVGARVSATNTLTVVFHGGSAGALPTPGEIYIVNHIPQ